MPSGRNDQTVHIGTRATIDLMNEVSLPRPGELGKRVEISGKAYQVVLLDSGATASTGAGVTASGQVAFWKDRTKYLVTNDKPQAEGGPTIAKTINSVAGVFTTAVDAGKYCVVQQRGPHATVLTSSGTAAAGDYLIVLTTGGPAGTLAVASGTALVSMPVGRATGATVSTATPVTLGGWDTVEVP